MKSKSQLKSIAAKSHTAVHKSIMSTKSYSNQVTRVFSSDRNRIKRATFVIILYYYYSSL